jgi:glycosyltransferase involved in cell wall biosynthesis
MSMACIKTADSPSQVPIRVAVIVPTYKQPGLLAEALDTALHQRTDFGYSIVVVEDGCPFPETAQVCRDFAAAHPGRIHHLRKRNNGLSAARNTGIEFALAAFPGLEAVYFLDSDNRIQPLLLQRLFDALRRSGPEIGWAYPDIDKFGFPEFCDTSGAYSPLEHLFRNVSEAGSMASRRLLDAGARFDETMRKGWEDWEFWLQGLELGFRGVHVPFAGFRYRCRGESMLTNAERDTAALHTALHCRHPGLYGVKAIARLEAEVSRRYAIYLTDLGIVRCLNGGGRHDDAEDLTEDEFAHRALRLFERPGYAKCPGQVIVMDSALFALLASRRLLDGVLWTLERAMMRATVVTCAVHMDKGSFLDDMQGMEWQVRSTPSSGAPAMPLVETAAGSGGTGIIALEMRTLLDLVRRQPADTLEFLHEPGKRHHQVLFNLTLHLPGQAVSPQCAIKGLSNLRHALAARWSREEYRGWTGAQVDRSRAPVAMPRDVYLDTHALPSILQVAAPGEGRAAALVVDPAGSAQAVPVALRFGGWLRQQGWRIDLVALGKGRLDWPVGAEGGDVFDRIIPVPIISPAMPLTSKDAYLGTPVGRLSVADLTDALGTLAGFDVIVSIQHGLAHTLTGQLRKLQVEAWALLGRQLLDAGSAAGQRLIGPVTACAAFEHAYQRIIALDPQTSDLCRAVGIPADKLYRWGDAPAESAGGWERCPPLELSAPDEQVAEPQPNRRANA